MDEKKKDEKSVALFFHFLFNMFHFFFSDMFSIGTLQVKSFLDVTILVKGEMIIFTEGGT